MVLIGEEYIRRELEFIPATYKVVEYYSQSYGCPSCREGYGDTEKSVIVKSQVPAALVGKGLASASTVAWTMYQKYADSLPLYRQEKDWKQYGAQISRTTLANWIIYCSQNYFQPMYDYFHAVVKMVSLRSSCMDIRPPEAAAMQRTSWKDIMGIWKRMAIRAIAAFRISNAVPAGHTSGNTLSMLCPKESNMITACL